MRRAVVISIVLLGWISFGRLQAEEESAFTNMATCVGGCGGMQYFLHGFVPGVTVMSNLKVPDQPNLKEFPSRPSQEVCHEKEQPGLGAGGRR